MNDSSAYADLGPGVAPTKAADGGHVPGACNTLGEFVRALEDGQFDADCYEAIKKLSREMQEHAWHNGGKSKGKVTITLDFVQEGGVTEIKAAFKVVEPVDRRPKSILWSTEDNRLTRVRPGQHEMFSIRDVSTGGGRVIDA